MAVSELSAIRDDLAGRLRASGASFPFVLVTVTNRAVKQDRDPVPGILWVSKAELRDHLGVFAARGLLAVDAELSVETGRSHVDLHADEPLRQLGHVPGAFVKGACEHPVERWALDARFAAFDPHPAVDQGQGTVVAADGDAQLHAAATTVTPL